MVCILLGIGLGDEMIPHQILNELKQYDQQFIYFCPHCGFKTMMDRGKHFQCQNTMDDFETCGADYEYPGTHFKEPEEFEKWRKEMIAKFTTLYKA